MITKFQLCLFAFNVVSSKLLDQHFGVSAPNLSIFDYTYRLPENIVPISYKLELKIDANTDTIKGSVEIKIKVKTPTNFLILHAHPDYIRDISVAVSSGEDTSHHITDVTVNKVTQTVTFELYPKLGETQSDCTIKLSYTTVSKDDDWGIMKLDTPTGPRYSTPLEMLHARKVMPCFDEPQLKATFQIKVELMGFNSDVIVLSNSEIKKMDGNVWLFEPTNHMSTYLLSIAIGNYRSVCSYYKISGCSARKACHWLSPNITAANATEVAEAMNDRAMETYCKLESYLDITSPAKLDFVVDSHLGDLALEQWGLVSMGSKSFGFHGIVVHEIAHYWFGNLVSPESWPHLWVSEAFATYVQTFGNKVFTHPYGQNILHNWHGYFAENDTSSLPTVIDERWANDYVTPHLIWVVYFKGSLIVKMLHDTIGEECFRDALRIYMKSHAFSHATTRNLLEAMQKSIEKYEIKGWDGESSLNITAFLHPYIYKSGMPKLEIRPMSHPHYYWVTKQVPEGDKPHQWPVPLWSDEEGNKEGNLHWVIEKETLIETTSKEVKLNKYHYGYYALEMQYGERVKPSLGIVICLLISHTYGVTLYSLDNMFRDAV